MTIDDKIGDEELQHGINRETAKISALSSRKIFTFLQNILQVSK